MQALSVAQLPGLPAFVPSDQPVESRMHWVRVATDVVENLFNQVPLKIQRNHLRRLLHADHLTDSNLPLHANYLAVRLADGSLQLLDGYTRMTAIHEGKKPRPDEVWLGVVDADSVKQAEQLYLAVDSRKAVKTGRDAFEEGLRKAKLLGKLTSPVFINGYAVSAVNAAAGDNNTLANVVKFKKGIERLDTLKLEVGRFALPAGALAACLLLAQNEKESDAVLQFTAALARPDELTPTERKLVPGALKFSAWLQDRRTEGALSGRNVPVIMAQALGSFWWQQHGGTGRIVPITRQEYLQRH